MCSENKLKLTTLRELPVGAAFVRHDEWGSGTHLLVKLSEEGILGSKFSCFVGSPGSGQSVSLSDHIEVQRIDIGEPLEDIVRRLASSV